MIIGREIHNVNPIHINAIGTLLLKILSYY